MLEAAVAAELQAVAVLMKPQLEAQGVQVVAAKAVINLMAQIL
jgi:hypothetical protein